MSLDYHDMVGQIYPKLTVDEYAAKMGKDSDIVTLTFLVKSKQVGEDLVDWLERGYEWVLDASVSDGEVEIGKYLVFAEMNRRSTVPSRVIEVLDDLSTLTDISLDKWAIEVDGKDHKADEEILNEVIICNPAKYRIEKENEEELNEMREIAGLASKQIYAEDEYIRSIKSMAGL